MRSIKVFVISIIIMMLFFSLLTLLLPSKVTVSKSIVINASVTEVAKEIGAFENWKKWYPAFQNHEYYYINTTKRRFFFRCING